MRYKNIVIKLPNGKEERFHFDEIYNIEKMEYRTLSERSFKRLNKIICSKFKSIRLKELTSGTTVITFFNKNDLKKFFLESIDNELISFDDFINLSVMINGTSKRRLSSVIYTDAMLNEAEITIIDNKTKVDFMIMT